MFSHDGSSSWLTFFNAITIPPENGKLDCVLVILSSTNAKSKPFFWHVHAPANLSAISFSSAQIVQITTDISSDKVVFPSISTRGNGYAQCPYPMNARSMSGATAGDFPASGSSRQKLAFALKYAALAPTESGWQPWYFRLANTYLELMTKNNPAHEAADPERREFMIGCGSALLYLKLALKHFGCLGQVALFPDLGQPALVARVHFERSLHRLPASIP